jgi:hypothetical protein
MPNTFAIVKNIYFGLRFSYPQCENYANISHPCENIAPHLLSFYWRQVFHGLCIDQHNKTPCHIQKSSFTHHANTWRCFVNDYDLDDFPTEPIVPMWEEMELDEGLLGGRGRAVLGSETQGWELWERAIE